MHDQGGPTGLRVEYTNSYASPTMDAIPEPETYTLMLAGLAVLSLVARRRNTH